MIRRLFFIILYLQFFAVSSYAHPHIFLNNKIQVIFDQEGVSGFKAFWYADDFSTAGLTDGYDENDNGVLEDVEIKLFEKDSLNNLSKYHYFTYLKINNKPVSLKSIDDFKVSLVDKKIVFSFFIPFKTKAKTEDTEIVLSQYDRDYFSFISFADKKPVTLINDGKFQSYFNIEENKKETYYFGSVHPIALILRFKKS